MGRCLLLGVGVGGEAHKAREEDVEAVPWRLSGTLTQTGTIHSIRTLKFQGIYRSKGIFMFNDC